jgi:hypothetical protein
MPIFTPIATAIFAGTALAGTFIVPLTAFGLSVAAGVGLSYAAQALAGERAPQAQAVENRTGGLQGRLRAGGEVPRSFPLGATATDGSLVYANYWGNDGETPNAYFTQVIDVSDMPTSLRRAFVNGEPAALGASGPGGPTGEALAQAAFAAAVAAGIPLLPLGPFAEFVANYIAAHGGGGGGEALTELGYPVLKYRKDGKDHCWIKFYDGTQLTADPFLVSRVATPERPWGPDCVGKGVAYAICTHLTNDTLFASFPTYRFELSGIRLYDPSRDDTAGGSGAQRWSDPSTWGGDGDNLPAVQAYNVMRGISYGGQWLYGLQNLPAARLPNVAWINAVNACRSELQGEFGLEPAYRAGHECLVSTVFADTIELLMTACHGKMAEIGGVYKMRAGPPGAPVLSFTDADIIATESGEFHPFLSLDDTVTGIVATYPEPEEGWTSKEAPALFRADFEDNAANRKLLATPAFDAVPYAAQVQRLMKSALLDAQRERQHTHTMPPHWYQVEPLDVVQWTSEENGYDGKLFDIAGMVDRAEIDPLVNLKEVDPADYGWNHNVEFNPVTRSPIAFQRPEPQAILAWFAEGDTVFDRDGLSRRPAIRLEWGGNVVDVAAVQWEVRNNFGAKDPVTANRTDSVSNGAILISQNLLPRTDYEVRGRYIPANPRDTLWSDWIAVTTPDVRLGLEDVVDYIRYNATKLEEEVQDFRERVDSVLARVRSAVARSVLDQRDIRTQLAARSDNALASIDEVRTVAVSASEAVASLELDIEAQFNDAFAAINQVAEAVATEQGISAARWAVKTVVGAGGQRHVAGIELLNLGQSQSAFIVVADLFQIAQPGVDGGAPVPIWTTGLVNGTIKNVLRSDLLVDAGIFARHIAAGQVKAGHIEAGSIGTQELAVGGVSIQNLIAGAATNSFTFGGATVTVGTFNQWHTLASDSRGYPGGRIKITACFSFVDGVVSYSIGGQVWVSSVSNATRFRIRVDGGTVREFTYPNLGVTVSGQSLFFHKDQSPTLIAETSITAGVHSIDVQTLREDANQSPGSASIFFAPTVVVTELRR